MTSCLRPFQEEHAKILLEGFTSSPDADLAAFVATGYGKTFLSRYVMSSLMRDGLVRHVVFASPQKVIRSTFEVGGGVVLTSSMLPVGLYPVDHGVHEDLLSYLRQTAPTRMMAVCYPTLSMADSRILFDGVDVDLTGSVLVVDEAHHAWTAKELRKFIGRWRTLGGRVMFMTATPGDLEDPLSPVSDRLVPVHHSLVDLMEDGYAPGSLKSAIVGVDGPGVEEDGDIGVSLDVDGTAASMARYWDSIGRPPLIIQCRNFSLRELNERARDAIIRAFQDLPGSRPIRIRAITNVSESEFSDFQKALATDCSSRHEFDVIVGMNRVGEGLNWPRCASVFRWGIPSSVTALEQLIGRAMRKKDDEWRDKVHIALFAAGLPNMEVSHSRQVFLTSAFLASFDISRKWSILRRLRKAAEKVALEGLRRGVAPVKLAPPSEAEVGVALLLMKQVLEVERDEYDALRPTRLVREAVAISLRNGYDIPTSAFQVAVLSLVSHMRGVDVASNAEAVLKEDPDMELALEKLIHSFRHLSLRDGLLKSGLAAEIGQIQEHILGAEVMRSAASSLEEVVPEPDPVGRAHAIMKVFVETKAWVDRGSSLFRGGKGRETCQALCELMEKRRMALPSNPPEQKRGRRIVVPGSPNRSVPWTRLPPGDRSSPVHKYFPRAVELLRIFPREIEGILSRCAESADRIHRFVDFKSMSDEEREAARKCFQAGRGLSPVEAADAVIEALSRRFKHNNDHSFDKEDWRSANIGFIRSIWASGPLPGPCVELLGRLGDKSFQAMTGAGLIRDPKDFVGVDVCHDIVRMHRSANPPFRIVEGDAMDTCLKLASGGTPPCYLNYDGYGQVGNAEWWRRYGDVLGDIARTSVTIHGKFALILNCVLDVPFDLEKRRRENLKEHVRQIRRHVDPDFSPSIPEKTLAREGFEGNSDNVHAYRSKNRRLRMITFRVLAGPADVTTMAPKITGIADVRGQRAMLTRAT